MLLERYDLVALNETWGEVCAHWSAAMDVYRLFRRDR